MKEWYEYECQNARVYCKDGAVYEGYVENVLGPPDYEPEEESVKVETGECIEILLSEIVSIDVL